MLQTFIRSVKLQSVIESINMHFIESQKFHKFLQQQEPIQLRIRFKIIFDSKMNSNSIIESQYKTRKSFMNSGRRFLLDNCIWKPVQKQSKKSHSLLDYNHFKRYLPSTVVCQNSFYIYGGALVKVPNQRMLYSMNIRTGQWHGWKSQTQMDQRNSHSSTVYQNALYFFGGNDHNVYFNDLRKFEPNFNRWTTFQSKGNIPAPRDRAFMSTYNSRIFIFGGHRLSLNKKQENSENSYQSQVFEDAFLWKQSIWTKLNVVNPPSTRVNAGFAKCGERMFMFGGQSTNQPQKYYDEVYQLLIDQIAGQLKFIIQPCKSEVHPVSRSGHCMAGISDCLFLVFGGQAQRVRMNNKKSTRFQLNECNNAQTTMILRDFWIYNINQCQWMPLQPKNGPFTYLNLASCAVYQNICYIFGGIDKKGQLNNELFQLIFGQDQIMKTEICAGCQEREKKRIQQLKDLPKRPLISIGFIYNLALQIKFPFQAITLLADAAMLLNARHMNLTVMKGPSQFNYLDFQFNGNAITKDEFMAFVSHSYNKQTKRVRKLIDNIKLGAFRLGKTFLFISADSKSRKVIMISADSRITPMFDQRYIYYAYIEDIDTGTIQTQEGVNHKNFIENTLKAYVVNIHLTLCCKNKNSLLIFTNNSVTTKSKIFYSELHSYTIEDFKLYKNPKKIEFLDQLGYDISRNPEVSLASYLSFAYDPKQLQKRSNNFKFTINEIEDSVIPFNYSAYLEKLSNQKIMNKIPHEQLYQQFNLPKYVVFNLYTYYKDEPLLNNEGILIYVNGKLINRYGYQFGNLFFEKFYKTKYKKAKSLYTLLGVIEIKLDDEKQIENQLKLELNLYGSGFRNNAEYKRLVVKLQKIVNKYKFPRQLIDLVDEDEEEAEQEVESSKRLSKQDQQEDSKSKTHKKVKMD